MFGGRSAFIEKSQGIVRCLRERVPRGQTRHLASMFETLADVAVTEVTLGRFDVERMSWSKRNKSVPPPTATGRNHQQSTSRTTLTQKSAVKMTEGGQYFHLTIHATFEADFPFM